MSLRWKPKGPCDPEVLPGPFDPGRAADDGMLGITGANVVTGGVVVGVRWNTGALVLVGGGGGA